MRKHFTYVDSCTCTYIHVCTRAYTYTHMHLHLHPPHTHTPALTHTPAHTHMHIHMYAHTHEYMHIGIRIQNMFASHVHFTMTHHAPRLCLGLATQMCKSMVASWMASHAHLFRPRRCWPRFVLMPSYNSKSPRKLCWIVPRIDVWTRSLGIYTT